MNTRRQFLIQAPLGVGAVVAACRREPQTAGAPPAASAPTPGAPPTFGTAPAFGPEVSPATFAEAEKLAQVTMTPAEREMAAASWREVAGAARSSGGSGRARWRSSRRSRRRPAGNPVLAAGGAGSARDRFVRAAGGPGAAARRRRRDRLRAGHAALALGRAAEARLGAPHPHLSRSHRSASIRKLRCVITLTKDHALAQAKQADAEIAAGQVSRAAARHSVRGQGPARHRRHRDDLRRRAVPEPGARRRTRPWCERLHDAGAVLIAKLSLGALALNDIWFGGQTMNPWLLEEGASGSSAGPGAATAAGLVGFSIGSETGGSIVSPAMRCGITGLRPTFGRVAAHRRDDAVLVARQARPDDARRGGRDAGAPGDQRSRCGRRVQRAEPARLRRGGAGRGTQGRLLPGVDEGEPGDRRGPRRARDGAEARHGAGRGHASRLALRLAAARSCSPKRRRRSRS